MVTIIVPAFNCESTILESLKSIKPAGKSISEVIICNDGSNDSTKKIVESFISFQKHDSIEYHIIDHEYNEGGAAARNTAAEKAKNNWIFCLDSDNILMPNSIDYLFRKTKENPEYEVFSFRKIIFFVDFFNMFKVHTHEWIFPPGRYNVQDHLNNTESPGASGNYLFSKSAWEKVGKYRVNSRSLDSWCLGFDFLNNNIGMYVTENPGFSYYHRYGIDSYWVRESKKKDISSLAEKLIIESKPDIIQKVNLEKMNLENWFFKLNTIELVNNIGRRETIIKNRLGKYLVSIIQKFIN